MILLASVAAATVANARATTSKVTLEAFTASSLRLPAQRSLKSSSRRAIATTPLRRSADHAAASKNGISDRIRALMRESAQPVALVTTLLPSTHNSGTGIEARWIHGATLSSFSSVSLDPNLICFSMKTPSKLADALAHHVSARASGSCSDQEQVDFVVNVLADTQASLAAVYAVPGTPPLAYAQTSSVGVEHVSHPLRDAGLEEVKAGAVPVVKGALGALGCQIVESVDLSQYGMPKDGTNSRSMLYIARVVHVYTEAEAAKRTPLMYHRQKFVSTGKTSLM